MKEKKLLFIADVDGAIIDIIKSKYPDYSNKTIKSFFKHKMVYINGKIITNSSKVITKNSKITIYLTPRRTENYNLEIIYEDDDLIAINKPSGLLSISNSKEKEITAFRMVSDYIKKQNPKNKLFVVHRLDQDTSGVLIFSKNLKLKEKLQNEWNEVVLVREYIAIVTGKIKESGTFKTYLKENHAQIVHSTNDKYHGKLAITNYKLLKTNGKYSMLEVRIDTGRRNQIRVHLSENGNPIVGDKKYGTTDNSLGRLALHANKLVIIDPRTKKKLEFSTKIPVNFQKLMNTK